MTERYQQNAVPGHCCRSNAPQMQFFVHLLHCSLNHTQAQRTHDSHLCTQKERILLPINKKSYSTQHAQNKEQRF